MSIITSSQGSPQEVLQATDQQQSFSLAVSQSIQWIILPFVAPPDPFNHPGLKSGPSAVDNSQLLRRILFGFHSSGEKSAGFLLGKKETQLGNNPSCFLPPDASSCNCLSTLHTSAGELEEQKFLLPSSRSMVERAEPIPDGGLAQGQE